MAFPTGTYTGASGDLDVYIPEVWGSKINDFAKEAMHITRFFTDRSDELSDGGDTVHTPNVTEMSANNKAAATAVTLNSPTETDVDLVVSTWKEVSFAIEDAQVATYKKSYYLQEKLAKNAGYTAGLTLEDAIATLFASFSSSVGSSTTDLVDSDIRKAIGITETATLEDTDNGNFGFFFDRKVFWNNIAGISTYQLNTNTPTANPVMKQPAKYLYGIPVWTSSRIVYVSSTTGRVNALAHVDAIHYAIGKLPRQSGTVRVQTNYVSEYLSNVTTADILFGAVMNRATYGCKMLNKEY